MGGEETKSGVEPDAALTLAKHILTLPNLKLLGVMAIPPIAEDPEASRPYFRRLGSVLDGLNAGLSLPTPLTELSMGRSQGRHDRAGGDEGVRGEVKLYSQAL